MNKEGRAQLVLPHAPVLYLISLFFISPDFSQILFEGYYGLSGITGDYWARPYLRYSR